MKNKEGNKMDSKIEKAKDDGEEHRCGVFDGREMDRRTLRHGIGGETAVRIPIGDARPTVYLGPDTPSLRLEDCGDVWEVCGDGE